jgi:hypothetical protein
MSVMHAYSGLNEPANHTEGYKQARACEASPAASETETVGRHCISSLAPKSNSQRRETRGACMISLLRRPFELHAVLRICDYLCEGDGLIEVCKNVRRLKSAGCNFATAVQRILQPGSGNSAVGLRPFPSQSAPLRPTDRTGLKRLSRACWDFLLFLSTHRDMLPKKGSTA